MRRLIHSSLALSTLTFLILWSGWTTSVSAISNAQDLDCATVGTPTANQSPDGAEASPAADGSSQAALPSATAVELEHGNALLWGNGERGLLLLHGAVYDAASWDAQAQWLAGQGFTVLALEELAPDAVQDGLTYLMSCGASGVTVIGASAGGGAALTFLAGDPEGITGLILLSATGDVANLGDYPKLFVASEAEGMEERLASMANDAPGSQNQTLILPGSAHAQAIFTTDQSEPLLNAILAFLEETVDWKSQA